MTPWWFFCQLFRCFVILYYVFFCVLWIRNLCDGILKPIPQIPKFFEVLGLLFRPKARRALESRTVSFITLGDDDSHRAFDTLLAGKCIVLNLWVFATFLLCVVLSKALEMQVNIIMTAPMLVFSACHFKSFELSLAIDMIPRYQYCARTAVLREFLWEDFAKWRRIPSFKFLLGTLNCTSAVSHGTMIAQAFMVKHHQHAFMIPVAFGYNLHLCWLMALAESMSFIWVLGLIFEPSLKWSYEAMQMKILGFDSLHEHMFDETNLRYVPTKGDVFRYSLDCAIVKTLGQVLPSLFFQRRFSMAMGGHDLVAKLSTVLSLLLLIKQAAELISAMYGYLGSDSSQQERGDIKKYSVLFEMMALATSFLIVSLSVALVVTFFW